MRRGVKIGIAVVFVIAVLIAIAIPVYLNVMSKTVYHITSVSDVTNIKITDFAEDSELQFNENGTFHIHIELNEQGTILSGIGTYEVEGKNYNLNFIQAYGTDDNGNFIDYTERCNTTEGENKITCTHVGSQFKFTGFKAQTIYFG